MKLEAPRQNNTPRPQSNAPVNICVYKVTDSSGDVWPEYPDTKLWQIQAGYSLPPLQRRRERLGGQRETRISRRGGIRWTMMRAPP